jgi:hypothetical protein
LAGDADHGFDEVGPAGSRQSLADGEDFGGAFLLTRPTLVDGRRDVDGRGEGGECSDGFQQIGLIILKLDEQMVVGGQGYLEGFFGRAWRRV